MEKQCSECGMPVQKPRRKFCSANCRKVQQAQRTRLRAEANPEKTWHRVNPEKMKVLRLAWYAENREQTKEHQRCYYQKNKEKILARARLNYQMKKLKAAE